MKFWNKADNALYIYGDIVSEKWNDADTTAKSFVDDLKSLGDGEVILHLNSSGGDVFAALAISNVIKAHGNVNIVIDGICASAATLIAVAGKKVSMAHNALFMIHQPAVSLLGYYGAEELNKVVNSLTAVQDTIIKTYESRSLKDVDLAEMLSNETWFTALEAQTHGFIDEVTGDSDLKFDDSKRCLFVNKVSLDCSRFDAASMNDALKYAKVEVTEMSDVKDAVKEAVQAERLRVKNLTALKCENAAVNAIINLAMEDGKTVDEIKPYIEAVSKVSVSGVEAVAAAIRDNLTSGAEGVLGSAPPEDKTQAAISRLVNYANAMI